MENNVEDFIEEYEVDRKYAIDHIDMFRDRIERRIIKLAIVDIEYFYENLELLDKAKMECYDEIDWLLSYMTNKEEYECCSILKYLKLTVEGTYASHLNQKIIQTSDKT
tara:strand:- start:256 stop:582 length:327 start_codon:yes stop_codon:yes gene_type:complete